jgi:hypothetical protein
MNKPTGNSGVGVSFADVQIGVAYERAREESEFGLPVDYIDPHQYHAKAPEPERIIGMNSR